MSLEGPAAWPCVLPRLELVGGKWMVLGLRLITVLQPLTQNMTGAGCG